MNLVPEDYSNRLLLTIHGVMSDNAGLARLRKECESAMPGLLCDSFFYGSVVPYRDLPKHSPFIFRTIREKLELLYLKYLKDSERRLYIVAHSFGTLAL